MRDNLGYEFQPPTWWDESIGLVILGFIVVVPIVVVAVAVAIILA